MSEAKIEEKTVCEDRISELPEDVLVRILSLLPTKEAVTTMILSKRWRFVWKMVRTLHYKDSKNETYEIKNGIDVRKESVWWFLNKSLQFHKTQLDHNIHVIENLLIELRSECPTNADVGKWIAYAVDRGLRMLKFKLLWSIDPFSLPKSLFSCETLKHLILSKKILVDIPFSSWLPSLLRLELSSVEYQDEASLVMLLSSCPVLSTLIVKRKKDDNVRKFSVKVPSLRSLSYINYESDVEDENDVVVDYESDVEDTKRCLVIDTPALKMFKITDYSGDSCLVENMPGLKYAIIDIVSFPEELISSLSSVLSLELDLTNEVVNHCSTIDLSQLLELTIYPDVSNWLKPLMLLLENAPKLRKFTIDSENYNSPWDLSPGLNQLSYVPRCLSSQLERFEWIEYRNHIDEKEFLTYVFANSKCLKTAKISLRSSYDSEFRDLMLKGLKDIPRVSKSSELL